MGAWAIQTQLDQREWEAPLESPPNCEGFFLKLSGSASVPLRAVDEALGAERGPGLAGLPLARDVPVGLREATPRAPPAPGPPAGPLPPPASVICVRLSGGSTSPLASGL